MGTSILIIAFIIEAAFAAYCIFTKSNQKKIRSFVRIGAFAAFVLFALVSVIQMSFRWYGLAALLLVWAVLGAWRRIRKTAENKEYNARGSLFMAVAMLLLVVIALIPALIFPQHEQLKVTGQHRVATINYTYTDASRIETFTNTGEKRKVNVECWYPDNTPGKFPLVVFSHGSFSMRASNTSTFTELASNGYVACSIDHPYQSIYTIDTSGKLTLFDQNYYQEVNNLNSDIDQEIKVRYQEKWIKLRTADMNFVIDTMIQNANNPSGDAVYQLIDTDKVGVFGHSLGGATAATVARERNDIDAIVNLDGPLLGELTGYTKGKYVMREEAFTFPLLNIYSDDLWGKMEAGSEYSANVRIVSNPPADVYNVNFKGAKHLSFTDLSLVSPILANILQGGPAAIDKYTCLEKMNSIVLGFFDRYLKGDGNFTPAEMN
jgi:dienelactone hydrolase